MSGLFPERGAAVLKGSTSFNRSAALRPTDNQDPNLSFANSSVRKRRVRSLLIVSIQPCNRVGVPHIPANSQAGFLSAHSFMNRSTMYTCLLLCGRPIFSAGVRLDNQPLALSVPHCT